MLSFVSLRCVRSCQMVPSRFSKAYLGMQQGEQAVNGSTNTDTREQKRL